MDHFDRPNILIAEDESSLGFLLKEHLRLAGFTMHLCKDGEDGWEVFQHEKFDLCVLDVNMPKKDGFQLARDIRNIDQSVPIIFLTANSAEEDKLKGFEIGADEYITKPFSVNEFIARIKAILKRTQNNQHSLSREDVIVKAGNYEIDVSNHTLKVKDKTIRISSTEAGLFKILILNKNNVVARNSILLEVWGRADNFTARNLDVYINRLRRILKEDSSIEIVNIHGAGFKLAEIASTGFE
ncbi:MAG: response regulator transcription factor [Bacteroidia bacterium]